MKRIANDSMAIGMDEAGILRELFLQNDKHHMNWLIDPDYLESLQYPDFDKLMGCFSIDSDGTRHSHQSSEPTIQQFKNGFTVIHVFPRFNVRLNYALTEQSGLNWSIEIVNASAEKLAIDEMIVWLPLAYAMFRDADVKRNMTQSCALFPSISPDFSRFAAVRRDGRGTHLGVYNTEGRTKSLGSFCRFENRFLEQVSPSLDGLIFHALMLAGGQSAIQVPLQDWMYRSPMEPLTIAPGEKTTWRYLFKPFEDEADFAAQGLSLGFPAIDYTSVLVSGGQFTANVRLPEGVRCKDAKLTYVREGSLICTDLATSMLQARSDGAQRLQMKLQEPGEYKLSFRLEDGREDIVVFSVLEPISNIIEARAAYLCEHAYTAKDSKEMGDRYAFQPVSNQGESLGKLSMILLKNRLGVRVTEEICKVELSAVRYVIPRWFKDGDFRQPVKLYGSFYRIFDYDYIAHIFYLLSRFDEAELALHEPRTYLLWAAELMVARFDEERHADERERRETRLTGVFTLYIHELMDALRQDGRLNAMRLLEKLSAHYDRFIQALQAGSAQYQGAITEHYYDNAGFGPSCEALCRIGDLDNAERYGELLLANIGFSNDYRAQNPDRWWEGLSYMIHSLWGGLAASASLTAYEHLRKTDYAKAAYRSMMAVFSCYDWNIRSTAKQLEKGEAASTYSVASPNLNKPSLSRNRFGQSVFEVDVPLLAGNATGDDWDMGEELAAYLGGFGTKTFLYYEDGEVRCINGYIEETDGVRIVTSYAAYPQQYYFFETNDVLAADPGELLPQIVLDFDNRMKRKHD